MVRKSLARRALRVLLPAIFAALVLLATCAWWFVNLFRAPPDEAMWFDPWFTESDRRMGVRPILVSRAVLAHRVSFALAVGPGAELKLETLSTKAVTSRITYRLPDGSKYRIVQYPQADAVGIQSAPPVAVVRGRAISGISKNEKAPFWSPSWSSVEWRDPDLGYVELASDTLSTKQLVNIATRIIAKSRG